MISILKVPCELINYEILPAKGKVQLYLIREKKDFEFLLKQLEGVPITVEYPEYVFSRKFVQAYPLFDFTKKAKLYKISNGLIAVDQSEIKQSNPYILCKSIDEYFLINQYLLIYKVMGYDKPLIECGIHEHSEIEKFLQSNSYTKIDRYTDNENICYKSDDGKYIYVRYSAITDQNRVFLDRQYQNESVVYYDLVIYESLEVMNLLRLFDLDPSDIDEENFPNHKKEILISKNTSIPIDVINKKNISRNSPNNKPKETIGDSLWSKLKDGVELENGMVLFEYSNNTLLRFKNKFDYNKYRQHLDVDIGSTAKQNDFSFYAEEFNNNLSERSKRTSNLKDLIGSLKTQDSLILVLRELDKKLNRYLFDSYFIHLYFVPLSIAVGELLVSQKKTKWYLDEDRGYYVIKLNNEIIDFIPLFYREMKRQVHNGFCSTEAIIDGILFSIDNQAK